MRKISTCISLYICMKWEVTGEVRKSEKERKERERKEKEKERKKREKEKEKEKEERERENREKKKFRAKIQRDPSPLQILLVCSSINKVRGEWG